MARNRTKWGVVEWGPLTPSGRDEILAAFEFKKDAQEWMKLKGLNRRRSSIQRYRIVKLASFETWPTAARVAELAAGDAD